MSDTRHDQGLTGGCACEALRFRLTSAPLFVHCCHCTACQRETGSAFALNALIETDRIQLSGGEPLRVTVPSESGSGQQMIRCGACGVTLWSHYGSAREKIAFLRVGTLDRASAITPDIHIYTRSKQPWVALPSDHQAVPEYYRRSAYWPEESILRLQAAVSTARDA